MILDYSAMGNRIKECRKKKDLTQEKIAEIMDMSVSFISRIERGSVKVSLETLVKIASILDVSPCYFIDGTIKTNNEYLKNDLINTTMNFDNKKMNLILELAKTVDKY